MSPPTNGMQASAAAILEGNPVDCAEVREAELGLVESARALEEAMSARKDQPWYC